MAVNLVFFSKHGDTKKIPIKEGITILGRRPDCDVRIPVLYVSRKHCRIVRRQDKTLVQDLGSANGTFLNRERVMEAPLSAGDRIAVGPVTFTVEIDGQPGTIERPASLGAASAAELPERGESGISETLIRDLDTEGSGELPDLGPLPDLDDAGPAA